VFNLSSFPSITYETKDRYNNNIIIIITIIIMRLETIYAIYTPTRCTSTCDVRVERAMSRSMNYGYTNKTRTTIITPLHPGIYIILTLPLPPSPDRGSREEQR